VNIDAFSFLSLKQIFYLKKALKKLAETVRKMFVFLLAVLMPFLLEVS
jgi:hypothetical protein